MKKRFLLLSILAGLVVAFGVWYGRPGLGVEKVFPSHPLVFGRLVHMEEHIHQIIHSDFGKSIASINLPDILSRNNFSARDIRDFKRWQDDGLRFWNNPLMRRFLSQEVAMAAYRDNDSYQVFMALRLTPATRIAELLGNLSHWGEHVTIQHQDYQGYTINHLLFKKDLGLSYVRIRDLLIVTPETTGNLKTVVDAYRHTRSLLADDAAFNFVRHNAYAKGDGLVLVNSNLLFGLWQTKVDSRLTPLGYEKAAFPVFGLSYKPGAVSKFKFMVGVDEDHMSRNLRKVFDCPAMNNDTMKLVPVDAIAYNWGGCYDLGQAWGAAKKRLEANPDLGDKLIQFKRRLERHFHINIRKDVLPVLGHEIGGYLTDVDMQGNYPFPVPRLLVFIKVEDRARAEGLLESLTENSNLDMKTDTYDQVPIHYFTSTLGANIDPGYSFLGDYLLVATSSQLIKRSIQAYNDSFHSLVSNDIIAQFSLGENQKFHSVTLMKTGELSRRAQDFLGWMDKYLSDRVTMAAAYKQDGDSKRHELDEAIADKSAELLLAQKKLMQLKQTSLVNSSMMDPSLVDGAIANLSREEDAIKGDIAAYSEQKQDLSRLLDNYALGAQSDKLTMYNMDNLVSPVLKGLESIDAQAVTVRFGGKILETEFLVK